MNRFALSLACVISLVACESSGEAPGPSRKTEEPQPPPGCMSLDDFVRTQGESKEGVESLSVLMDLVGPGADTKPFTSSPLAAPAMDTSIYDRHKAALIVRFLPKDQNGKLTQAALNFGNWNRKALLEKALTDEEIARRRAER